MKAADEGDSGEMVVSSRGCPMIRIRFGTEVKNVHKIANDETGCSERMGK